MEKFQSLVDHVLSHHSVKLTQRRNSITLDAITTQYPERLFHRIGVEKLFDAFGSEYFQKPIKCLDRLVAALTNQLLSEKSALEGVNPWATKYRCYTDAYNSTQVLLDVETNTLSSLRVESLKTVLTAKDAHTVFGPEATQLAIFSFDPYDMRPIKPAILDGVSVTSLNLYKKPEWMLVDDVTGEHLIKPTDVNLPLIAHEFMEHLFPDSECRRFVWSWMHHALTNRAETYLVLNGKKGIGKNLFSENFLRILVGEDNWKVAQESIVTSDFTAVLDKSRMVVMDEVKIDTPEKVNKLKRYINSRQNIEKKGVDADQVTKTYNSFVVQNNDESDMRVEHDDRRFSVIDLTKDILRVKWGQKKIDAFIELMATSEFQQQLGYYVLYFPKEKLFQTFDDWRGPHFYRLVYISLAEWKRTIVDTMISRAANEYDLRDVRATYKVRVDGNGASKFPTKTQRIREFLEEYRHNGTQALGTVIENEEGGVLVPHSDFLPSEFSTTDMF